MPGIVTWSACYKVKATLDQIGAFYQNLATRQGFTETRVILGRHDFNNPDGSKGFRYMVFPSE